MHSTSTRWRCSTDMFTERSLRVRRAIVVVGSVAVPATLVLGFGHRGQHMARNLIVPGGGLIDERPILAVCFLVTATVATVAWVKWGVDWSIVAVVVASTVAAGLLTSPVAHSATPQFARSTHEFPLVIIVAGAVTWTRSAAGRLPGIRRLGRRRARSFHGLADIDRLSVVDRCRCASIVALSAPSPEAELDRVLATMEDSGVARRAARIGLLARGRRGPDPFSIDHAHARAALSLTGRLPADATARFVDQAGVAPGGVPASEPSWVRPLDGTLAAVALERAGDRGVAQRWTAMLTGPMSMRRGHRPACWWTPLGVSAGSAPPWEHAAATAIARAMRWVTDDDWAVLRPRVLGAAARGTSTCHDERLIAAGRVWLAFIDDDPAAGIVKRPSVRHDPIAVALDRLARRLTIDPNALCRTPDVSEGISAG